MLEQAHGGTLFLDEIADMPIATQARILRVLTDQSFSRVGGTRVVKVDVRVVSATARDLMVEIAEGRFREDLYYRLNVIPIDMPPLRERGDDIPELVRHFLHNIAKRTNQPFRHIEPDAVRMLQKYHWPGNVRELQNLIERAVVLETDPGVIRASTIEPWLQLDRAATGGGGAANVELSGVPLADIEKKVIISTLRKFAGHRVKTATALGIGVRTLGMKIKKWKEDGELVENA
jgi:two-component system nitrogen regulation response regulator NtrX